jgi:transposase
MALSETAPGAMLADKGYDADRALDALDCRDIEAVIPPRRNRCEQRSYDAALYRERNLIERMFNKLKHYRRLATRYEKTALSFLSFLNLIAAKLWLPFVNRT